jgi:hypothetical protein
MFTFIGGLVIGVCGGIVICGGTQLLWAKLSAAYGWGRSQVENITDKKGS